MIKRVDFFMPPISRYGVLEHATKKLMEAFQRAGVQCRLLIAERENPEPFLKSLFGDKPDLTISFNGLLPDNEGRFFCDMIQTPHLAVLVDMPYPFAPLIHSPYSIVSCPDQIACNFFRGIGFDRVIFLPQGIEKELEEHKEQERIYDVLFPGTLIDYIGLRDSWKKKYPLALWNLMEEAADMSLASPTTPYVEVLVKAVQDQKNKPHRLDPTTLNYLDILNQIATYTTGRERMELIQGIKDAEVHVFGSDAPTASWESYLKDYPNVTVHDPVAFEQALEIMQQSKIVLNSVNWIKNGGHERIFGAAACGAVPLTRDNAFTSENFKDGQSIELYEYDKLDVMNQKIQELLKDESKRKNIVDNAKEIVFQKHTWDQRAALLLEQLEPIVADMKKSNQPQNQKVK